MRIAAVCEAFPRLSERFLARDLAALAARGIEPLIFTLQPGEEDAWSDPDFAPLRGSVRRLPSPFSLRTAAAKLSQPVGIIRTLGVLAALPASLLDDPRRTMAGFIRLAAAWPLARTARQEGCELIWGLWASLPGAVAAVAARAAALPLAVSCHAWDVFVNRAWLRMVLRQAKLVTVCNSAAAARISELPRGAAANVQLVRHVLPGSQNQLTHVPFPAGGRPRVLAVGRLVPKKGFEFLLAAAAAGEFAVEIAGDGPDRSRLEGLAAGHATFSGRLDGPALERAYARCDALCTPSVIAPDGDRDGLPNVVLESARAGLPVIATDAGGLPDFAMDGRTALVVPQRNAQAIAAAVGRLRSESGLAGRLVEGTRKLLRTEFAPERSAARLAELLRAAAGRRC